MTHVASTGPAHLKSAVREQWDRSAKGWNDSRHLLRSWLGVPTEAMLEMAGVRPGMRVLDVAAGAGDQTLDIAVRVGPGGSVLATDISSGILAYAKANAAAAGHRNVETLVTDGEGPGVEAGAFDAAICRLGLMLFPEPAKGLAEMYRALRPGGKACTMVFATPDANPCVKLLVGTAMKHAGLPPRDPFQPGGLFSLGKPGAIDALFEGAGLSMVSTTKVSAPMRLASVAHYLDFVRTSASPILQIIAGLDDDRRRAVWTEVEKVLAQFNTSDGWVGPHELLLTVGQR